ncbi:hypothetical protein EDD93_7126 [Streptomyces sp. 840.1]|nr:hypothetical protein EDD93_7126 [Streptomyces sp. 840.1]
MTAGEPVVLALRELPARPLATRRRARRVQAGPAAAGRDAAVPAQAMTRTEASPPGVPAVNVS